MPENISASVEFASCASKVAALDFRLCPHRKLRADCAESRTAGIGFRLDPTRETKDLETFGMRTERFIPSVAVGEENEGGWVACWWGCNSMVYLSRPVSGSGGTLSGGSLGDRIVVVGPPEIWLLTHRNGANLWLLATLDSR